MGRMEGLEMAIFERSIGGGWWIEVEGESCEVRDAIGMAYLYVAVENAGKKLTNTQVMALAGGDRVANLDMELTSGNRALDEDTLRQHFSHGSEWEEGQELSGDESTGYQVAELEEDEISADLLGATKRRIGKMKREEQKARATGRVSEAEMLAVQIKEIEEWLAKSVGLGGKPRKLKGTNEKARQSVSIAIQRALAEMDKANPIVADYFKRNLVMGVAGVKYVDREMRWELSRLVPADIPVRLSERVDRR